MALLAQAAIAPYADSSAVVVYATPLLVEHHGQKDILVPGQNRLTAFDAKSHAELWRYGEGEGQFNGEIISSPVYSDGMVFLQLFRESKIHAIRLVGKGKPPETVWVSKKPGPVESSVLYYRGLLYALMDNGVLVCLDGKTGDELYRERLSAACNSSPVASDGLALLGTLLMSTRGIEDLHAGYFAAEAHSRLEEKQYEQASEWFHRGLALYREGGPKFARAAATPSAR